MKSFVEKIKPFAYITVLYLLVSFVMRAIFMLHPITTTTFSVWSVVKMITIGLISDVFTILLASSILVIYLIFIANVKYKKPYGGIILGIFILILLYIQFYPNNIFAQYGGVLPEIALAFFGFKTFCFALLLFFPKYRIQLRNILYFITLAIYVFAIVMNEVIGNIMESYPVVPLFSAVFIVVLALTTFLFIKTKSVLKTIPTLLEKAALLIVYLLLALVGMWSLPRLDTISAENTFAQEIQSNGVYKFYYAFTHSELDFFQFYPTLPEKEAESIVLKQLNAPALERQIVGDTTEVHRNVLLISVESLSAEYLTMYGNTDNRTPFLDSLANNSLFFTNLYATGNRTVRGLEALTLCIPPTPGESVVKRKDNKDKFTTGSVFKSKGYDVKYLYGGDSYFDNMKDFFGGNGYDIIDNKNFTPEEVTFSNIWGVCDEDMANKAIKVMNEQSKAGKPFFNHWMTVSNHRPFTYPEGKIDIPPTEKSRAGGVKYTDYALKRFFEMAKQQKWYKNTIFVIVADHCASSAGSTELPLDGYRIPCFIVADFITPKRIDVMMSQIDVMPTVFGLLNFNYTSKFIGQDVLKEGYQPRAYIATYQDLGYLTPDKLTIISPLRKTTQYSLHKEAEQPSQEYPLFYEQVKENNLNKEQADACIGTYQATAEWLKNKQYNAVKK